MVKKSSKSLVGALALATAFNSVPALAENSDLLGNNLKCDYSVSTGFFDSLAHFFAYQDNRAGYAVRTTDGGRALVSNNTDICKYNGKPYGSDVSLIGRVVSANTNEPTMKYKTNGLREVIRNENKAYLVGGAIIVVGLAAANSAGIFGGGSSASTTPSAAPVVAPVGGGGCGGGI